MILFVGCSFTWGAGLQYEYLIEKENYSFEPVSYTHLRAHETS